MRSIYLLFIILFLGCNHPSAAHQSPDYVRIADNITAVTAQKIEKETRLRLMGVGGGAIDHIRKLNMSFQCLGEITVEQGRKLLVYCATEYLAAINASEPIKPYLIHHPFTPEDIEIEIFIYKPDRRSVPTGALSVVCAAGGQLRYKIKEPRPVGLQEIHEETFEQALKILRTDNPV